MILQTITPEYAKELLAKNTNNRNCKERVVRKYANEIKNDNWKLNGETIKISKSGRLLDGQHRLNAVILANKPIQTYVIDNLDENVFDSIDIGSVRTSANILEIHTGKTCKDPKTVSSALKLAYSFDNEDKSYHVASNREYPVSHTKLIELYNKYPNIEQDYDFIMKLTHVHRFLYKSVVLGLYIRMKEISHSDADRFWLLLNNMTGLNPDSPIVALQHKAISYMSTNAGKKMNRFTMVANIVHAWNCYRENKSVKYLRINPNKKIILK